MHLSRFLALAAGIVAIAAAAPPASAAAAADPAASTCTPPGKQLTDDVARDKRADGGSEVTEYLAGGEYRVTLCDKQGDLKVSQTVSPIRKPDGGVALVPTEIQKPGVTVSVLYGDPDEPAWAADFRAASAPLKAATITPVAKIPVAPETDVGSDARSARPLGGLFAQAAAGGDACTNPQYRTMGGTFKTRKYTYRINRGRFNYNAATVAQIVRGHTNWDASRNSCHMGDITKLTSHYGGSTSAVVHPDQQDGISVTDRGSMAGIQGCTAAIACTFNFPGPNNTVAETDQRFNSKYTYSNAGAAGKYDTQSIATHEAGHSIGLDHADSSKELTMFFQTLTGTTYLRSLAKGDVRGLRARYP
jgi:hypothetical protein